MPFRELKCNYVDQDGNNKCQEKAVWEIWFGNSIDDHTLTCRRHVSDLLTDEDEHRIFKVLD